MPKKILIIDDDLYIRELYEEVMKDAGYSVEVAIDGQDGLDKIAKNQYDLVLLDVMMPKMDGLSMLTQLAKQTNITQFPVIILLTNLAHDPILKEALSKGARSYLIKTDLTPDQLVLKVQSFLQ